MLNLRQSPVRKISAAATAALRELMGTGPKFGVVFHHIPKCAGSSIARGLRLAYPPWTHRHIEGRATVGAIRCLDLNGDAQGSFDADDDGWARVHEFRQRLLFTYLDDGARVVCGHVVYSPRIHDTFAKTHKFITVLREPVARFVSQFLWSRRSQAYDHVDVAFDADGLARLGPIWGCAMTTFLGGLTAWSSLDRAVENAKRAIDRLDIVGFTEDLPGFQTAVARELGARIPMLHDKRGPKGQKDTVPLAEMRPLIEKFCAPDIEVYNHARSLLKRADRHADVQDAPAATPEVVSPT